MASAEFPVNKSDKEEYLDPSKSGYSLNSGNSVGNRGEWNSRGDFTGEFKDLRNYVAKDGKLANTAVLKLSSSIEVKCLGISTLGKT